MSANRGAAPCRPCAALTGEITGLLRDWPTPATPPVERALWLARKHELLAAARVVSQ